MLNNRQADLVPQTSTDSTWSENAPSPPSDRRRSSAFLTVEADLEDRLRSPSTSSLETRLKSIAAKFDKRTQKHKERIQEPVTSSSDTDGTENEDAGEAHLMNKLTKFLPTSTESLAWSLDKDDDEPRTKYRLIFAACTRIVRLNFLLDGQSNFYIGWLILMGFVYVYNAWVIPLRGIFPYQDQGNESCWFAADIVSDVLCLFDTFVIQSHKKYIVNGELVDNLKDIRKNYLRSRQFKIGMLSLCPVDIICTLAWKNVPWLRLPRLLRIETFWELFQKLDSILSSPYPVRISKAVIYMLYLIHMYACAYYAVSSMEKQAGVVSDWIHEGEENIYIRCFYFATKTATSIGKNPKPEHELEFLFMSFAWLSGVFVFAVLLGQVRDIVATAAKNQTEYRELLSAMVNYLRRLEVSKDLQEKALQWLNYTWNEQKTLNESKILSLLPSKMQSDVALQIHIEMVSKVKLFRNCEPPFLRDLVLKLCSITFLPGEYVCRKGEVGREMYIVKSGRVDVIGGGDGDTVIASLRSGAVFGEIALLQIGGMDKRTADVRSAGFSNLFMLSKRDLEEVVKDYPVAQESLRKQARKLLRNKQKDSKAHARKKLLAQMNDMNAPRVQDNESDIIFVLPADEPRTPKLLDVVLKVASTESKTLDYIRRHSNTDKY